MHNNKIESLFEDIEDIEKRMVEDDDPDVSVFKEENGIILIYWYLEEKLRDDEDEKLF